MLAEQKNNVVVGNATLLFPIGSVEGLNLWTPAILWPTHSGKSSPNPSKTNIVLRQYFHIYCPNLVRKVAVLISSKDEGTEAQRRICSKSPNLWKVHLRLTVPNLVFLPLSPSVFLRPPPAPLSLFFLGLGGNLEPRSLLLLKTPSKHLSPIFHGFSVFSTMVGSFPFCFLKYLLIYFREKGRGMER